MNDRDPLKKTTAWEAEPLVHRLQNCALLLLVNELITDAEREKIHTRMLKWIDRHNKKVAKGNAS